MSRSSTVRHDLILLITAIIWGFAFVAQRMGMEHIGPFLFNGIRFALGALVLVGVQKARSMGAWRQGGMEAWRHGGMEAWGHGGMEAWRQGGMEAWRQGGMGAWRHGGMGAWKRGSGEMLTAGRRPPTAVETELRTANRELPTAYGLLLGLILFAGASFQQVGIVYTTAGNAGFITGLYVILVPLFGIFSGQKASWNLWIGALFAVTGLYFLSITRDFKMSPGDLLVLVSAVFWAIHVLYTGWLSPRTSAIRLAIIQFAVCSVLSFITAFIFEKISFEGIYNATWPILYGGILSVGIAYTLQIVGQKKAPPTHAAIIMSLETVFAVIGGVIILSETMNEKKWLGCGLMLLGMVMAQVGRRSAVSSQQLKINDD